MKQNEEVFKKHFKRGMKTSDYEMFKREYPTLLKCILGAMNEVAHKSIVEKAFTTIPGESHKRVEQLCNAIEQQVEPKRVVKPYPTKGWVDGLKEYAEKYLENITTPPNGPSKIKYVRDIVATQDIMDMLRDVAEKIDEQIVITGHPNNVTRLLFKGDAIPKVDYISFTTKYFLIGTTIEVIPSTNYAVEEGIQIVKRKDLRVL